MKILILEFEIILSETIFLFLFFECSLTKYESTYLNIRKNNIEKTK